ncbi:MAG: hypothetical protein M5U26_23205 [Planctomycetota bacterium]|nr:hypothetical protein [Planctomycetota bacterium]
MSNGLFFPAIGIDWALHWPKGTTKSFARRNLLTTYMNDGKFVFNLDEARKLDELLKYKKRRHHQAEDGEHEPVESEGVEVKCPSCGVQFPVSGNEVMEDAETRARRGALGREFDGSAELRRVLGVTASPETLEYKACREKYIQVHMKQL